MIPVYVDEGRLKSIMKKQYIKYLAAAIVAASLMLSGCVMADAETKRTVPQTEIDERETEHDKVASRLWM